MFQTKSVNILENIAKLNTESFKGNSKHVAERLAQAIDMLKDVKQKHLDQNKNTENSITKMSKQLVTEKGDEKNFTPTVLLKLINCKNFTNALNKTEELLAAYGLINIVISESLAVISDGIITCAKKRRYSRIFCQLGLIGTIYEQGEIFEQIVGNFTHYAVASVHTITADLGSCFKQKRSQMIENESDVMSFEKLKNTAP